MRDHEFQNSAGAGQSVGKGADTCAIPCRESAVNVLRNRATSMRDEAMRLLEDAKRYEQLANASAWMDGLAEEALYRLAMDAQYGRPPRAF